MASITKQLTSFGLDKKSSEFARDAVSAFLDTLGLVPRVLITKEVTELIYQSWLRELQREELEEEKRKEMAIMINKLSELGKRKKPKKVLDNMQPLNFKPLYENVSTAYYEEDM